MDYVYDIVLNLQSEYYDFYEWKSTDKIINVKRLPIYKISNSDYLNIKNNDTSIDKSSIPIPNKLFLVTSGIEVMGLLINNNGKVIKKSSLIFEESDDILEDKDSIKSISIKYDIIHKNKIKYQSRAIKEKSKYINTYLHNLDIEKDEYYLKYLYYDIYNIEPDNSKEAYNSLLELSKKDVSRIYAGIKRVNSELKNK